MDGSRRAMCMILLAAAVQVGCRQPEPARPSVGGMIHYNPSRAGALDGITIVGKPVAGAKVAFLRNGNVIGYGITNELGQFQARTYPETGEPIDGLAAGDYDVKISKLQLIDEPGDGKTINDFEPTRVTIESGGENSFSFKVLN